MAKKRFNKSTFWETDRFRGYWQANTEKKYFVALLV